MLGIRDLTGFNFRDLAADRKQPHFVPSDVMVNVFVYLLQCRSFCSSSRHTRNILVPVPVPPRFGTMTHDSATMDRLIVMCSAATRSFAEAIDVPGVPDWLLIRLQGHANGHSRPCV